MIDDPDLGNYKLLVNAINEEWIRIYQGEYVTDVFSLTMRIKNIGLDRDAWLFNTKVLQKQVNVMEKLE